MDASDEEYGTPEEPREQAAEPDDGASVGDGTYDSAEQSDHHEASVIQYVSDELAEHQDTASLALQCYHPSVLLQRHVKLSRRPK